ncbi:MAG: hypothetical protein ACQER4_09540 [Bacteroidota bacterium]
MNPAIAGDPSAIKPVTERNFVVGRRGEYLPRIALITTVYRPGSHADKVGSKFFLGIPTDEEVESPGVQIVSVWIDQTGDDDLGAEMAERNGARLCSTIEEALTLGGDGLAVDGVLYIGEHGDYPKSRLGVKMQPRLNHLEQIFRVFDATGCSVPVFSDKYIANSWLDAKWVYDRSMDLGVPLMAGSSLPYCRRNPVLDHPLGTTITEAVAIGPGDLDSYGIHILEMLQCMVERRSGGETGVYSVQGLKGDAVWKAIDAGEISMELLEEACKRIPDRSDEQMRDVVRDPVALRIRYNDGLEAAILILDEYVNSSLVYAARADDEMVATEFKLSPPPVNAHFSYMALNIREFFQNGGRPPVQIERNLLTNGVLDMGFRSLVLGKGTERRTPFLDMAYTVEEGHAVWPQSPLAKGPSLGPWPPEGYEFLRGA